MPDYDQAFELDVLSNCLRDLRYLRDAAQVLDKRIFEVAEHSWIWKTIRSVYEESGEVTSGAIFLSRANHEIVDNEDRGEHLAAVARIMKNKNALKRAPLEELRRFVIATQLAGACTESIKLQEEKRWDEAYAPIEKLVLREKARKRSYEVSKWAEEFSIRQAQRQQRREHPELFRTIPTGFKHLDRKIKGAQEGELCGIMATTNMGKSIFAVNIGYAAIMHGFGVVHFSTEMGHDKVAQRYDSRITRVEYRKFKNFDFTQAEKDDLKRVSETWEKFKGRLRIVSTPLRAADINLVRNVIEDLRPGMKSVDMIIVDSGDHLQARGKFEKNYLAETSNYWDLKDLAEELNMPIWVTIQATREFETKLASTRAAAGSYDKARICDLILSINQPEKDTKKQNGIVEYAEANEVLVDPADADKQPKGLSLYIAKNRDAESKQFIPIEADLKRMLIREIVKDDPSDSTADAEEETDGL